jgi:hypothetical protein
MAGVTHATLYIVRQHVQTADMVMSVDTWLSAAVMQSAWFPTTVILPSFVCGTSQFWWGWNASAQDHQGTHVIHWVSTSIIVPALELTGTYTCVRQLPAETSSQPEWRLPGPSCVVLQRCQVPCSGCGGLACLSVDALAAADVGATAESAVQVLSELHALTAAFTTAAANWSSMYWTCSAPATDCPPSKMYMLSR